MKIGAISIMTAAAGSNCRYKIPDKAYPEKKTIYQPATNSVYYTDLVHDSISFGAIANSKPLRILFKYGLPCMYTGKTMIDPKSISGLFDSRKLHAPAIESLKFIEPYKESLSGMEKRVFNLLQEQALIYPEKSIAEIFQTIAPKYQKKLRKKQAPIFKELLRTAQKLPEDYHYKFIQFMIKTNQKLQDKPIIMPFNSTEFKYKLGKIKEYMVNRGGKGSKAILKLTDEAEKLPKKLTPENIEIHKEIINNIERMQKHSPLKDSDTIEELLRNAKQRLNGENTAQPFSRKSFIYDLAKLLRGLNKPELEEKLIDIAQKLPTSKESLSAYILKSTGESSNKIAYRLLWPSTASVEHILPKSCGGPDSMKNFGGACNRENSERGNRDFVTQIKRMPKTPENCQKFVDRLIELANNGVFDRNNIDKKYIYDFKRTIQLQSQGKIVLDITALKPDKPKPISLSKETLYPSMPELCVPALS